MNRKFLAFFLIFNLIFPSVALAEAFNPHFLLTDDEMTDTSSMSLDQIQEFLTNKGSLGGYRTIDVDGLERSAAEIIWRNSQLFELNPKFLLVLLQREQSLIEDPNPSQRQLDWAMGYAICDDCSKEDPRLQKFKGFGQQVYYAAQRIRESYLKDLEEKGFTISEVGPDREVIIDGTIVRPVNYATSVLYTYTPHLHGNENFVKIWNRWFVPIYPHGTLLQNSETGGVWLIHFDKKRPITSKAAFYSRFSERNILVVSPSVLDTYEEGYPINFPNYSLLKSPEGHIYLVVDDSLRKIDNMETFRQIGFNPDEIVDVENEDLEGYVSGEPITSQTAYPKGALIQNPENGGIYYVENSVKHPIFSKELLEETFPNMPILPGEPEVLESYETGEAVKFPDGTLVAVPGSPDVFVISNGEREHIVDEFTFLTIGWDWDNIIWTNERTVLEHPLGDDVKIELEDSEEEPDLQTAFIRN